MQPVAEVVSWLQTVSFDDLFLSVITIQEVRTGAESMPPGRRRKAVEVWLEDDLLGRFSDRILEVNSSVADLCGQLIAQTIRRGHTPTLGDALIAATAKVHGLAIATLNRKDFERFGVELVNF